MEIENNNERKVNKKAKQSKNLTRFSYKLGLNEHKMLTCFFAKLQKNDKFFQEEEITSSELASICGFDKNNAYNIIKDSAKKLSQSTLNSYSGEDYKLIPWFASIVHEKGIIRYQLNSKLEPELLQLYENKKIYVSIDLSLLPKFKSIYALRLYLILKGDLVSYKLHARYTLEEICNKLMLSNAYNPKGNISAAGSQKAKIIEPAINEINEISDIYITFEPVKSLRKILGWEFTIKRKSLEETSLGLWYKNDDEVNETIKELIEYGVDKPALLPLLEKFKEKEDFIVAKLDALNELRLANNKTEIENKAGWLYEAIKNSNPNIRQIFAKMAKTFNLSTEIAERINKAHTWSDIIQIVKETDDKDIATGILYYAEKRHKNMLKQYKRRYREHFYYDENGHLSYEPDETVNYDIDEEVQKIYLGGTSIIEDPLNLE